MYFFVNRNENTNLFIDDQILQIHYANGNNKN